MIISIRKPIYLLLISMLMCLILVLNTGCTTVGQSAADLTSDLISDEDSGWSEETHSNNVDPDYETVFPQDSINQITIIISTENWEMMLTDMTEMMGEFGAGDRMGMIRDGNLQGDFPPNNAENNQNPEIPGGEALPEGERPQIPERRENPEGDLLRQGGDFPPGGAGFNMDMTDENPVWVTASIEFEGNLWENVGIRFKGNSSLRSAWSSGNYKIPFKLDFDQFEDEFPATENQRFYGFKQLSLANNFSDDSYLREKVTADIFREFGITSAHTAFYEVYVDHGEGVEYFGLYTMVEVVEDTVIEEQFSDDSGNLYKPEGVGATFAEGSFTEASFDKETNQEEADYSDILALFDALHADNRLTAPEAWRHELESVFDVDTFLRWLAANTIIQNWDTYGVMNHNYFLYTDPETGLITWIPWDNNMALSGSGMKQAGDTLSLSLEEVNERWPLIRYLIDDPVYQAKYETYLADFLETAFIPEELEQSITYYHDLISDSVLKETESASTLSSEQAFNRSVQNLILHINDRYQAVKEYLDK